MVTADVFVALDNVQFRRSSWQSRNQIVLNGTVKFLSVPVMRTGLNTKLSDAEICYDRDWRRSHCGQMRQAYGTLPGSECILEMFEAVLQQRPARLLDLNLLLIQSLAEILEIQTEVVWASGLGALGSRSERLIQLCDKVEARHYLSPAGSEQYLVEDGFLNQDLVKLHLQRFTPSPYPQRGGQDFFPYMSVVDVIANLGAGAAAEYVRRPSFPSYEGRPNARDDWRP